MDFQFFGSMGEVVVVDVDPQSMGGTKLEHILGWKRVPEFQVPTISHQDLRGSWVWRLTPVQGNSNPQVSRCTFFFVVFFGSFFFPVRKKKVAYRTH